jgi:hypothetical protein
MNFSETCEFNTIYILVRIVVWIDANKEKLISLSICINAKNDPNSLDFFTCLNLL